MRGTALTVRAKGSQVAASASARAELQQAPHTAHNAIAELVSIVAVCWSEPNTPAGSSQSCLVESLGCEGARARSHLALRHRSEDVD